MNTKYGELIRFVTTDKRLNVYVIISNVLQAIINVNVLNPGKADMESQCWKTQEPDQARTLSPQPPVELSDFLNFHQIYSDSLNSLDRRHGSFASYTSLFGPHCHHLLRSRSTET